MIAFLEEVEHLFKQWLSTQYVENLDEFLSKGLLEVVVITSRPAKKKLVHTSHRAIEGKRLKKERRQTSSWC